MSLIMVSFFISYVLYLVFWDDDSHLSAFVFAGFISITLYSFSSIDTTKINSIENNQLVYTYDHNEGTGDFCIKDEKENIDFCGNSHLSDTEKRIAEHGENLSLTKEDCDYMIEHQKKNKYDDDIERLTEENQTLRDKLKKQTTIDKDEVKVVEENIKNEIEKQKETNKVPDLNYEGW